jgi:hypothetical protein
MSISEGTEQAWTKFYIEYGRAMLAWAMIESELATLFSFLTRIPPNMAIKIFYAPRSFKGRTEIFKSALNVCKTSEDIKTFTRALIKKADHYSDCRNKFAHDQPLLHQASFPAVFDVLLVDAKGQFQSDREKQRYVHQAVSTSDLADIAAQFMNLADLIRGSWVQIQGSKSPSLDRLREQLAALPNLPRPKDQSPPSATLGSRRRSFPP